MRAWTIQTPKVLTELSAGRTWRASCEHVQPEWLASYQWMAGEMRQRLGRPTTREQMPIWLWCAWRGSSRPKPDLRASGHLPVGSRGIRIELQIDDARVLRSDFELWHYVLNGWYLPQSLQDEREFDAAPDRGRVKPSWQRIFDLDWRDRRYVAARSQRAIQGVCWELRPDDVIEATTFDAR